MTDDSINISIPKDGGVPGVTGTHAVNIDATPGMDENGDLSVTFVLSPIGDDALHGGGMTIVATLHKPEPVPNSAVPLDRQAIIGAAYAKSMLEGAQYVLGCQLVELFSHSAHLAAEAIREEHRDTQADVNASLYMIARCLLLEHSGDVAKAKEGAAGVLALAKESGLTVPDQERALAMIRSTIDRLA